MPCCKLMRDVEIVACMQPHVIGSRHKLPKDTIQQPLALHTTLHLYRPEIHKYQLPPVVYPTCCCSAAQIRSTAGRPKLLHCRRSSELHDGQSQEKLTCKSREMVNWSNVVQLAQKRSEV
eukprot:GHUV01035981.1.p1 GENE.GHUV01035981.1~~GHUV01035981.1.p1  ORF type:complete len:120 (-),score=4.79 GHUV01035981.1:55-414(-)